VTPEEEARTRAHALELAREAVQLAGASVGDGSYAHLQALLVYGWVLSETRLVQEAQAIFAQVEDHLVKLSLSDPEGALHILGRLVIWYHESGDHSQAQRLLVELRRITKAAYGSDHPRYLLLEAQGERWLTERHARPFGLWHF